MKFRYIELLGLPGAGKSTVARVLCRKGFVSSFKGLQNRRRINLAMHRRHCSMFGRLLPLWPWVRVTRFPSPEISDAINFALRHPQFFAAVTNLVLNLPDQPNREFFTRLLFHDFASCEFAARIVDGSERLMVDEGLCQHLYSLMEHYGAADETLNTALQSMLEIDGIIVFDISPESAVARVRERGRGWSEGLVDRMFPQHIDRVISVLSAKGVPIARINAEIDANMVAEEAETVLREWF